MEQRIVAVRILLVSVLDYLPSPVTSSGLLSRSSLPGPAPGKRVPCTYCRRTGNVRYRNRPSRLCPLCTGTGWRLRRKTDEQPWDEYVGEPVEEASTQHPRSMTKPELHGALERLQFEQDVREGRTEGERFGWERERASYDRQGSYKELRRAVSRLYVLWPPGYLQINRFYFRGLSFQPSLFDRQTCDVAEEWLAREMRGPVRVPSWLIEREADSRKGTVAELAAAGMTAGQIARRLGIPKAKVRRLLTVLSSQASGRPLPGEAEKVRS